MLKDLIRQRIVDDGPIPFDEFMEIALYHPEGFFGGARLRSEKAGDFLTSPEVSPMFGTTLASWVRAEHERIGDPFTVVEVAGGSGSLIAPLIDAYPIEAYGVEASPAARENLSEILGSDRVFGHMADVPQPLRGVIVANELIDNLPMAMAQKVGQTWRERYVGIDSDGLALVDAKPRPDVLEWLDLYAGEVPDGGWVEVQLRASEWLENSMSILAEGSILLIDYGDTAEGLLPRRQDGTLRTYRSHHLGPHPLDEPGETDITADVNFTALEDVARRAGAVTRLMRQDDFLTELGLRDSLSELRTADLEAAREGQEMTRLQLRSRITEAETLLHPRGLGDFRVLVVEVLAGVGTDPPG
jgi:SAM-dependent MidA family methyltransferase